MFHEVARWLVDTVGAFGYPGIFIMMALESTFVPIPSEAVMIPAGYLIQQGKMGFFMSLISSILGGIAGSYLNYFIALSLGRPFILRYGKYVGVSEKKFLKVEDYFRTHGEITIFIGRLIPVVRHLISFPAGLGRMGHRKFITYTALGAGIWASVLLGLGYIIGQNQELINKYLRQLTIALLVFCVLLVFLYIYLRKKYFNNK